MSHRAQMVALVAALASCVALLLWIGASGPPSSRPSVVQPQDNSQTTQKDSSKEPSSEGEKPFWKRATADPVAAFTLGILVFTAVLAFSTIGLWVATARSVALGRDEFVATHRPHIIILAFEFREDTARNIGARLTFVNAGTTRAKLVEIRATICWDYLSKSTINEPTVLGFADKWLVSGERAEAIIPSDISASEAVIDEQRGDRGFPPKGIICTGYIRYADERGHLRETGFYRRYGAKRMWIRQEGAEGEYSY